MIKKPSVVDIDIIVQSDGTTRPVEELGTGGEPIPGPPGPAGADGYTPVKGVDYDDGVDGAPGPAGADGTDGHSPVVAFGTGGDADRLTVDGTPTGPHLTGPQGPAGEGGFEFPVGYVLLSVVNVNPTTFLGYGTWTAFGAGRVLVGLDAADPDFDTAEETGGAKTSTPSAHEGAAVGNHAAAATGAASAGSTQRGTSSSTLTLAAHTHQTPVLSHSVTQPSNHSAMSVVQPYITCFFWKRTA